MYTTIDICLALLGGLYVGASFGVIVGGINRATKHSGHDELFHVPSAHREYEHSADGDYPRQHD